jgi:iron complex transport system ATP-binding protein
MIALHDLTIAIADRVLVRSVNATLRDGEFIAILGPNGVGKTTLLRTISSLHAAHSGTIEIDGTALGDLDARARARAIGFVTSDDTLTEALLVRDVVSIGRFPHHAWWQWNPLPDDNRAIESALAAVHMSDCGERLFSTLSSGERQRIWIAMGLAQETPALLLDEPTSHLDVRVAHEILALLRRLAREGKTVVCVLHDLNDAAAYADRIMLLGCAQMLAFDTPERALEPALVERAYGIAVEHVQTSSGLRVFPTTNI